MKIENVLSCFDGLSCGQIALQKSGIKYKNYFASEIDKHAIKVTQHNFPNTIQLGDINDLDIDKLPIIDLLIGGSPCQGFSFAGKQLNFKDPRSKLFFKFVRILRKLREKNPDLLFLLENVVMKKEYSDLISEFMGVQPILINASLVSAQNRKRLYWTNIPNVNQPIDKQIYLADIVESGDVDQLKSYCIDANYWKGTTIEQYIRKSRRQIVFEPTAFTERSSEEAKLIRKEYMQKYGRDFCPRRSKELFPRTDKKMNCLTSTYSLKEHTLIDKQLLYRKLTPIECERLQTVPDNYTSVVSNSQRYKMLGNGWCVGVISHIFNHIPHFKRTNYDC